MIVSCIPKELRERAQWVLWRYEERSGKKTKVPRRPDGKLASVTDPESWTDFETAITTCGAEDFDAPATADRAFNGIGFVLTADDPFCAIDIDHCIQDAAVWPAANDILTELDSYTEITPSGEGLRVWVRASLPGKGRRRKLDGIEVEIYDRARFMTVTGNAIDLYPDDIRERQSELDGLLARLFPEKPKAQPKPEPLPLSLDDQDVVDKMFASRHGADIRALWHGDTSAHGGDASAADYMLAFQIAFYVQDPPRIERLMRMSCLTREKWDKHPSYLPMTIEKAIAAHSEFYTPPEKRSNGKKPQTLKVALEKPAKAGKTGKAGKPEAQTEWLISRILSGEEGEPTLYYAPDQTTYIRLAERTWPIKSTQFRQFLRTRFYAVRMTAIRDESLKRVVDLLDAQAANDGKQQDAYLRVAPGPDGEIYIDLRTPSWQVVRVTAEHWELVTNAPVLFRRGRNSLELPTPERGGKLDEIRNHLNIDDDQWVLLASCLVSYLAPHGPYPVLSISGEQGSGKSSACRVIKRLIDPAAAELYSMPTQARDVMTAAQNNWLLAYENLSGLPPWLSDVFCVLSTGGGFSTRELYTDLEERVMSAQRPVVVNGIPDIVTRPDLLGRAIPLTLEPIETYRTESAFRAALEQDLPRAFGGLLDALSAALANREATITDPTARMADFAQWAAAASPGLGWEPARFLSLYADNRETAEDTLLESSCVANAIEARLGADPEGWSGTMSELWERLTPPPPLPRDWPKNARALSAVLRRLAPVLRDRGIDIQSRKCDRTRIVTLNRRDANVPGFASRLRPGNEICVPDFERDGTQNRHGTQVLPSPPTSDDSREERENIKNICNTSHTTDINTGLEDKADFASRASQEDDSGIPEGWAVI